MTSLKKTAERSIPDQGQQGFYQFYSFGLLIITFFILSSCSSTRDVVQQKHWSEDWDQIQHAQMIDGQASRIR